MSLDVIALFSCISEETALFVVGSIQGRLLSFFFNQLVLFLFEGGFYSRAASIQGNVVLNEAFQKCKTEHSQNS